MDWTGFVDLLATTFKDFDIPQVIQRAVVGGTLCTLAWIAVQFIIRPTGSIGWYRARTRELLRARHDIADAVTGAEAALTVLKQQLVSLTTLKDQFRALEGARAVPPARSTPSLRPVQVASTQPLHEEEDPSDRYSWRRERGG